MSDYCVYTKQTLIEALRNIRNAGWHKSARSGSNAGAVGNTLEDLLGIQENNLPLPNAAEWELKAQRKVTSSLLTLFHCEPSPRALKIVPYLLENFGWKHDEAGIRYPLSEKSFRQTLRFEEYSPRGFCVSLDENNKKIIINFDYSKIQPEFSSWKNSLKLKSIPGSHSPYWGYNDIFHKAGTKLGNCFYVLADSKKIGNVEYFKYDTIKMLSNFSINKFISAIKARKIYVDFDARTGHNHGTKYRIKSSDIPLLYENMIDI